jgi:hypothetical protein
MSPRTQRLSRRKFLLAAGAGGAVTAAAIIAAPKPPPVPASAPGKRASRGYQASAHIDNYYRTTKV